MLPTVEERMDSVIRALSTVVLASIPDEEKLAREQVQLSIGHLSILRDQIAILPQFEQDALDDAVALGRALLRQADGVPSAAAAARQLEQALVEAVALPTVAARKTISSAVSHLIENSFAEASPEYRRKLIRTVSEAEKQTANKERAMFREYGFDP